MSPTTLEREVWQSLATVRALADLDTGHLANLRNTREHVSNASLEERAMIAAAVKEAVDWARALPDEDAFLLLEELLDALMDTISAGDATVLARVWGEWRETALIHADRELLFELKLPRDTDEEIPRPRRAG